MCLRGLVASIGGGVPAALVESCLQKAPDKRPTMEEFSPSAATMSLKIVDASPLILTSVTGCGDASVRARGCGEATAWASGEPSSAGGVPFLTVVAKIAGWGESFWNGFFVPGAFRYMWVLHCTWLVNSAAHLWGDRPYDPNSNPAENRLVAIASIGEGWHNWHHKYPFDYAASEYGVLTQFNPTKLVIDTSAALGLVTERKRATAMWKREKTRLAAAHAKAKEQ